MPDHLSVRATELAHLHPCLCSTGKASQRTTLEFAVEVVGERTDFVVDHHLTSFGLAIKSILQNL